MIPELRRNSEGASRITNRTLVNTKIINRKNETKKPDKQGTARKVSVTGLTVRANSHSVARWATGPRPYSRDHHPP